MGTKPKLFNSLAITALFVAAAAELPAQTSVFPRLPSRAVAEAPSAPPPEPGRALAVDLGPGEVLPFVWIGLLKIWVGQFEITNGQYRRFDLSHESQSYYGHLFNEPEQPVTWVTWEDANNYCEWLTRTFQGQIPRDYRFRLPTEKEWQAFASCGYRQRYPWGNNWPPPDTFNYRGVEGIRLLYRLFHHESYIREHQDEFIVTAPVTRSGRNAWGLFGVGGNAWEWCQDWFDGEQITRSLRGASWDNDEPDIIAVTNRSDAHPARRNAMIGFRVVVAPLNR